MTTLTRIFKRRTRTKIKIQKVMEYSRPRGKQLILLNTPKLKEWLKLTRKTQQWLANRFNCSRGYVSRWLNNTEKLSGGVIAFLISTTKLPFDELFVIFDEVDTRTFYGDCIEFRGQVYKTGEYRDIIEKSLDKVNKK